MTDTEKAFPLRVIQLTDSHLMAEPSGALLGVNTRDSLDAVIALALQDSVTPDLILATGDLAQDGSEESYRVLAEKLKAFDCPSVWLPGNHDDVHVLQQMIAGTGHGRRQVIAGGWQFIQLDTSVHGKVHGELSAEELEHLSASLSDHPGLPALVSLHHHPVDIGCDWMADIGLRNRQAFWQVIERNTQVKIVLWGHIHQEFDELRHSVRMLATPSTCIQFESGSRQFSVEEKAPGYRWFDLHRSGDFDTGVCRAADFRYDLDSDSAGY